MLWRQMGARVFVAVASITWMGFAIGRTVAAPPPSAAERVVVQGAPPKHLHLNRRITNAEYREQVLALTPLGSTHEQVKACVLEEWRYGKEPINEYMVGSLGLADHIPLGDTKENRDLVRGTAAHPAGLGASLRQAPGLALHVDDVFAEQTLRATPGRPLRDLRV